MYAGRCITYSEFTNTEDDMPTKFTLSNSEKLARKLNHAIGVHPDAEMLGHDRVTPKMAGAIMKGASGDPVWTIGCGAPSSDINMADRLGLVKVVFGYGGGSAFTNRPWTIKLLKEITGE